MRGKKRKYTKVPLPRAGVPKLKNHPLWFRACHEAGHAVVAAEVGVSFRKGGMVVEVSGDKLRGHVGTKVLNVDALRELEQLDEGVLRFGHSELCVKLAGLMTQDAFNAFPGEGFTGNTQIDLARARKLATFLSRRSEYDTQELVDSARNRVAEIITRRRKEIRKLAQLVLKNRRVSPEEIGRVLGIELKVLDD
jgi:hypothetical protein